MSIASRSRHASMAADPVSPDVAPTIVTRLAPPLELVLEHRADQLQSDVLERERGPVEQLEDLQPVVERSQRDHFGVVERRVGIARRARSARHA